MSSDVKPPRRKKRKKHSDLNHRLLVREEDKYIPDRSEVHVDAKPIVLTPATKKKKPSRVTYGPPRFMKAMEFHIQDLLDSTKSTEVSFQLNSEKLPLGVECMVESIESIGALATMYARGKLQSLIVPTPTTATTTTTQVLQPNDETTNYDSDDGEPIKSFTF